MKKKTRSILILVAAAVLIAAGFLFVNGTPWGWYQKNREVRAYLDRKYTQNMTINTTNSYYDPLQGKYMIFAQPEGNRDLLFTVFTDQSYPDFKDSFFEVNWKKELEIELNTFVMPLFPDSQTGVQIFHDYGKEKAQWNVSAVPGYREAVNQNQMSVKSITTMVRSPFGYGQYPKIFDIIGFIRQQDYTPDQLTINFNTANDPDAWTVFNIPSKELNSIRTKDDIQKFQTKK